MNEIAKYLRAEGVKQADLTKRVKCGKAHMSMLVAGDHKPGRKLAVRLEEATGGKLLIESLVYTEDNPILGEAVNS
ncbi:MAG: hypothetical protein AB7M93_26090 [Candidatus Obscuribacterales bacterium]